MSPTGGAGVTPAVVTTVHVLGAGPVGLLMTALLQHEPGYEIRLYEKRRDYSRGRMVKLAAYLVADSIDAYRSDPLDGDNVEAVFEPWELEEALAFRQRMAPALRQLLTGFTAGFSRLNDIEAQLSALVDAGGASPVQRITANLTVSDVHDLIGPNDIVIDCTGCKSLLRDHLVPEWDPAHERGNTNRILMEHSALVTFVVDKRYECNEYCKYYKNVDSPQYKFVPSVERTIYDERASYVTGFIRISESEYDRMPQGCDGAWLREHMPAVGRSMDQFIAKVEAETGGSLTADPDVIPIVLNLYQAYNATNHKWLQHPGVDHPFAAAQVFLVGDSAIGSPYFQSISLGFECAMFLAGLLNHESYSAADVLANYERLVYQQWLRVYMRTKQIKHNKDLFETIDDTFGLLEKLHIF
jgi:hypothetical protein